VAPDFFGSVDLDDTKRRGEATMEGGKHAFLVLAHEDEKMLQRLVRRLSPLGPVYVHIDAKTDVSTWRLEDISGVVLPTRVRVYWGDWSMIEATTLLLEDALADPSNSRFTLISGSHYPIISNEDIAKRAVVAGNLVASRRAPNMPDGSRPESDYRRRFYRTKTPNGVWSRIKNGFMNRVVYFRRPLDWQSVAPTSGMRAGESYWSIDRDFAEYCVAQIRTQRPLIDYFKKIVCTDEKVFATLYGEFAGDFVSEGTTYSKWAGGPNPVAISKADIENPSTMKEFWFARKFTSSDAAFLDWLDGR
jgi:core-2/I-Branching enzyme